MVGPRSWSHACFCLALFLPSPPGHSSVHPLWLCISQEPLCRNGACRQRMSLWVTLTPASRVAHFGNAFMLLLVGTGSLKFWHNLCRSWCNFRRTFSDFLLGKTFVSWAWFRVPIRVPFWTPGVQNEGRFRDQNMDPENSWFSCAIADHIM